MLPNYLKNQFFIKYHQLTFPYVAKVNKESS
jgi:hypothetical protein